MYLFVIMTIESELSQWNIQRILITFGKALIWSVSLYTDAFTDAIRARDTAVK